MYYESLGLQGSAVSEMVEEIAKYVQWAWSGLSAPGYTQSDFQQNANAIKYNLGVFWEAKAEVLGGNVTEAELYQMNLLDIVAHKILASVDAGGIYAASPAYAEYLKAFLIGGEVSRPESDAAAAEGYKAAKTAEAASRTVGDNEGADAMNYVAQKILDYKKSSDLEWKQGGILSMIPTQVYLIAATALVAAIVIGKKK